MSNRLPDIVIIKANENLSVNTLLIVKEDGSLVFLLRIKLTSSNLVSVSVDDNYYESVSNWDFSFLYIRM